METQNEFIEKQLKKLGFYFRKLRIAKGYSNYEQFAFDNDIPRSQYGRYERGGDLRVSSLLKVLKAFDIPLEEFFKDFDKEDTNATSVKEYIPPDLYSKASEDKGK